MNAPLEDDDGDDSDEDEHVAIGGRDVHIASMSGREKLEYQAKKELRWFERELGSKAEAVREHLTCNALVEVMKRAFLGYVRETWAPATLCHLSLLVDKFKLDITNLGKPVPRELSREEFVRVACEVAEATMRTAEPQAVQDAHSAVLQPLRAALDTRLRVTPSSSAALLASNAAMLSEVAHAACATHGHLIAHVGAMLERDRRSARAAYPRASSVRCLPRAQPRPSLMFPATLMLPCHTCSLPHRLP